jgi:Zc3h12a-like Ribonuclease NYN domain
MRVQVQAHHMPVVTPMVPFAPRADPDPNDPSTSQLMAPNRFSPRMVLIDGDDVGLRYDRIEIERVEAALRHLENLSYDCKAVISQYYKRRIGTSNLNLLNHLENSRKLLFTPFKKNDSLGLFAICDTVPFLLNAASKLNAIVVSNRNFQNYATQNQEWNDVIKYRVMPYTIDGGNFHVDENAMKQM